MPDRVYRILAPLLQSLLTVFLALLPLQLLHMDFRPGEMDIYLLIIPVATILYLCCRQLSTALWKLLVHCPHCGKQLPRVALKMYCPLCGRPLGKATQPK